MFSNLFKEISCRTGIGVGHTESVIGAGIEYVGRTIKVDGIKRVYRNRAELMISGGKFTAEALDAYWRHNEYAARDVLAAQMAAADENGEKLHWVTAEEQRTIEDALRAEFAG